MENDNNNDFSKKLPFARSFDELTTLSTNACVLERPLVCLFYCRTIALTTNSPAACPYLFSPNCTKQFGLAEVSSVYDEQNIDVLAPQRRKNKKKCLSNYYYSYLKGYQRTADDFVIVFAVSGRDRDFFHKSLHSLESFDVADLCDFFLDCFRWVEIPYFHTQDIVDSRSLDRPVYMYNCCEYNNIVLTFF